MKILHVVPSYIPAWRYGGPIHSVHGLCKALVARGHEVDVFTTNLDGPADSDVPLETAVVMDGVKVWYYPSKRWRRLFWSPPMERALKANICNFDLVHLHSIFLWPTWAAARTARTFNLPYVLSPRGMLVKDLIRRKSRWVKYLWLKTIEQKTIENAHAIHVTSKNEADALQEFDFSWPPVCLVPNGIEAPQPWLAQDVSRDVQDVIGRGPYVLYLGRINWKKGLDRLIRAWRDVHGTQLVIAGNDDESYVSVLQNDVDWAAYAENVSFILRQIKGADKEALFAAARLFVLPSYSENFGITVLEAMARCCPVIVTPEVGAAEIVKLAKGGRVVNGDPRILAAQIKMMLKDAKLLSVMGQSGKAYVFEKYLWHSVVDIMAARCYANIKPHTQAK
jgi:glycosyltransferase involved in cell wall biosynthesis